MSESFNSSRFKKKVWLTNHAIESMAKQNISLYEVKELIELGKLTEKNNLHGWISYKFPMRNDNLVCAAIINNDSMAIEGLVMKIVYDDDTLFIEFKKGEIIRDESLNWNTNIGYKKDGIGEITILEAQKNGLYPLQIEQVLSEVA